MDPETRRALPMDAAELVAIGERLYGPWGWPVKIGIALGKDASTVRRWRAGSSIDRVSAMAIRALDAETSCERPWPVDEMPQARDGASRALLLVARVQALASMGIPAALRVEEGSDGMLRLILRLADREPLLACQEGDRFPCLDKLEAAVAGMTPGRRD